MLRGIPPVVSPELLYTLARMGHGSGILLADAHYPADDWNDHVIRMDGVEITTLLGGILTLLELDDPRYSDPLTMMAPVEGDELDPSVEESYREVIAANIGDRPVPEIVRTSRVDFYHRSEKAAAIVVCGSRAKYGNIILVKGVTPD